MKMMSRWCLLAGIVVLALWFGPQLKDDLIDHVEVKCGGNYPAMLIINYVRTFADIPDNIGGDED